ncbi:MAG: Lar family restriction alleviation protein [Synergistaceae bacterium]|nr:Lar family restriction alleviation protein [Synergistaceae bacterium]
MSARTRNERIRSCPFCGGCVEVEHEPNEAIGGEDWMHVVCQECGGSSGWYLDERQAISAWNMRV